MKKILFILMITIGVQTIGATTLVVKPIVGKEKAQLLQNIGKIVYRNDSLYIYDATQAIIYGEALAKVQHLRYSDVENNQTTDIENINQPTQIQVFPNPTQDIIHINNAADNVLRIYSINGALMDVHNLNTNQTTIQVSHYPAGSYILLCGKQSFQLIKQ